MVKANESDPLNEKTRSLPISNMDATITFYKKNYLIRAPPYEKYLQRIKKKKMMIMATNIVTNQPSNGNQLQCHRSCQLRN